MKVFGVVVADLGKNPDGSFADFCCFDLGPGGGIVAGVGVPINAWTFSGADDAEKALASIGEEGDEAFVLEVGGSDFSERSNFCSGSAARVFRVAGQVLSGDLWIAGPFEAFFNITAESEFSGNSGGGKVYKSVRTITTALSLSEDPLVFRTDLIGEGLLKVIGEHAPGIGLDL